MADLLLYDLHPSPNALKARLALGFLEVPYERVAVDPNDRSPVVEATGQPCSPAIVHGDVRLADSSAILRYLDANLGGGKRIYSADKDELGAIEAWELKTRGGGFGEPIGIAFQQVFGGEPDAKELERAQALFTERCLTVEHALGEAGFLVGDRLTAADLCVVPLLAYGDLPVAFVERAGPFEELVAALAQPLTIPEDCPRTREYVARVMAYDR